MYRVLDIIHFIRQIFFPNWKEDERRTKSAVLSRLLFFLFATKNGISTLFSLVIHAAILVVFSLIMLPKTSGGFGGIDVLADIGIDIHKTAVVELPDTPPQKNVLAAENHTDLNKVQAPVVPPVPANQETAERIEPAESGYSFSLTAVKCSLAAGGGLSNRNAAGREAAVGSAMSSSESENAVEAALEWLAAHQRPDGGWSLHFSGSCQACRNSGTSKTSRRCAATALALLPFLGAGYTHTADSRYKRVVEKGLLFLIKDPDGGIDGVQIQNDPMQLYSYGLAAMAICEAFAMSNTGDETTLLGQSAQKCLQNIEFAQAPDGGWRYRPGMSPGDTSVFAWQLMSLKSGKLAGLDVPQPVIYAAQDFLASVSLEGGRRYNYLPTGGWDSIRGEDSPLTCTAIGLLMRLYLGWKPGDEPLDDGLAALMQKIQQKRNLRQNLYFSYYAALAFHHYGEKYRKSYYEKQRDYLVRTQSHSGHESGSWYFQDPYCDSGGRLLNTVLATLILETPYRFMPLFK